MKILFFGDSITDGMRNRNDLNHFSAYGYGYVMQIAGRLYEENPEFYQIINRGLSGNRIVDLYARIKEDVWNLAPDCLSVLIGVNDIWHEIRRGAGVDLERYIKVYRMLIEDTKKRLPDTRIILMEPFILKGFETEKEWEEFNVIHVYAEAVENLAKECNVEYVPLQKAFEDAANRFDASYYLIDGIHPNVAGSALIAKEWIKHFKNKLGQNCSY